MPNDAGALYQPSFSFDGTAVVYLQCSALDCDVMVIYLALGKPQTVYVARAHPPAPMTFVQGSCKALLVIFFASTSARAQETCTISSDCRADFYCVEGECLEIVAGQVVQSGPSRVWHVMFGNGHGYSVVIAVADVAATVATGVLMTVAAVGNTGIGAGLAGIAVAPPLFTGPIVHFASGRVGPGIISAFAWASVGFSTTVVAGLLGLATGSEFRFGYDGALAGGLAFGAVGAGLLTYLDAWMAREVPHPKPHNDTLGWTGAFLPTPSGATVSFSGTW